MNPMWIIIAMVVIGTVLVLGLLVGFSVHREATRRERRRVERERILLDHDRMVFEYEQRATQPRR